MYLWGCQFLNSLDSLLCRSSIYACIREKRKWYLTKFSFFFSLWTHQIPRITMLQNQNHQRSINIIRNNNNSCIFYMGWTSCEWLIYSLHYMFIFVSSSCGIHIVDWKIRFLLHHILVSRLFIIIIIIFVSVSMKKHVSFWNLFILVKKFLLVCISFLIIYIVIFFFKYYWLYIYYYFCVYILLFFSPVFVFFFFFFFDKYIYEYRK